MRPATTRPKPKIFLDSSGLGSAVITPHAGSAMIRLVMLGEQGVIDLRISREVIADVERFVRSKNPAALPRVAEVIAQGRMAITSDPNEATIVECEKLIGYRPDARILAAAMECDADVLVTFDKTHLLGNPNIKPPESRVMVMNAQDGLDWCFDQWRGLR